MVYLVTPIGNSDQPSQNIFVHTLIKKIRTAKTQRLISEPWQIYGRFRWAQVLKCGSAAAHLLRLRLRTSMGHVWLSLVNFVCYQAEVSATSRSLIQRVLTECVSLNVISWTNYNPHLQRVGRRGQTMEEEETERKSSLPVRNTSLPVWIPARTGERKTYALIVWWRTIGYLIHNEFWVLRKKAVVA